MKWNHTITWNHILDSWYKSGHGFIHVPRLQESSMHPKAHNSIQP